MTPLERVAAKLAGLHPAWRETPWESIGSETRELFLVDARAVLQALREPSPEMVEAGRTVLDEHGCNPLTGDAEASFTAMIDAALTADATPASDPGARKPLPGETVLIRAVDLGLSGPRRGRS